MVRLGARSPKPNIEVHAMVSDGSYHELLHSELVTILQEQKEVHHFCYSITMRFQCIHNLQHEHGRRDGFGNEFRYSWNRRVDN